MATGCLAVWLIYAYVNMARSEMKNLFV